jgi:tetratricopeptide (TPR) repeat protein
MFTRTRVARVAALAPLLLMLSVPAHVVAAPKWLRLRTAHFELAGDVSEKQLKQVGLRFEQFRETFARLFPDLRQAPTPVVILVFGSTKAYQPFMPLFNGKRVDVGGYFMSRPDVSYISLAVDGGESAYRIIFHEYTHLLVGATLADVPVWVSEGLAEYYSTFEASSDGRQATLGKIVDSHVYLLRERFIPLRELISVRHDSSLYNEGDRRSIFYAESWALMHYFLVAGAERRTQLLKYLELYARGVPGDRAFAEGFGGGEAALERELRRYVERPVYQSLTYTLRDPVEIDRAVRSEPMSEADGEAMLGDLLLHNQRLDEAGARLERALTLAPGHVRATAALGRVRHLQSRDEDGLTLLADASSRAKDDPLPHYYYAATLLRPEKGPLAGLPPDKAIARQATALLERVVAQQPNLADALALLGYGRLVIGEHAAAVEALARAHAVSPRQEYALMTAQAYISNRNLEAARALLAVLAERGETPTLRQRAGDLLAIAVSVEHPPPGGPPTQTRAAADDAVAPRRPEGIVPIFRIVEVGETRAAGVLREIACSREAVVLVVTLPDRELRVGAPEFINIAFVSYRPDLAGGVACGRRATPEPVYVTWKEGGPAGTGGRAVAVEFLPVGFTP